MGVCLSVSVVVHMRIHDSIFYNLCIPEDWKSSVILSIYRGKGDPVECGS